MIDNFQQIAGLLQFSSDDDFYFCQILKRKKEHPELGSNSSVVKTYFIKSVEDLMENRAEMICLADHHNARVGINLNRRSFERIAFHAMKKTTDQIMNKDFRSVRKAYNSVCGAVPSEPEKKWIIDIDVSGLQGDMRIADLVCMLAPVDPIGDKGIATIPTKNGFHLITKPFNVSQAFFIHEDIHKDNPTILYIP